MKVVLFDLDDTLTDRQLSFGAFVPVFQKEYSQHLGPCDTERIDQAIITADRGGYRPKSEFFGELCQILPWLNRPSPDKLESFWRAHFGNCTIERPGARQLLVDLRSAGFRLAIITNGTAAMQNSKIHRLGLVTLVDAVLISETIGVKKPNAEIYNKAMQALASENSSALFVGDHPILDVAGPAALGMQTAWIKLGRQWPADLAQPDHIIESLDDLRSILGIGQR